MTTRLGLAFVCGLVSGCGAQMTAQHALSPGDYAGEPSMEALPSLDVDESAFTREMRMARLLSAESFQLEEPAPPSGRSASELSAWGEQSLAPWLSQKHRTVEAARHELDRAAAQSQRQRIVAGALVGLMYEDVARVLLQVPAPVELEREPAVLAMHRTLTVEQAGPYLTHAKLAYDACAANARAIESLHHWTAFCRARSEQLPEPAAPDAGESGQTTVRVERD
jgi:hypothetical protein